MKSLKTLLLLGVSLSAFTALHAGTFNVTHLGGVTNYAYLSSTSSYTNTFTLSPYNTATETVNWAQLSFAFADDNLIDGLLGDTWLGDGLEWVTIDFNTPLTVALWEVDGNLLSYDWHSISGVTGSTLVNALDDGSLTYTVSVTSGNAYLKEVNLKATSVARNVPDGGITVTLLGASLLGLLAIKRRK